LCYHIHWFDWDVESYQVSLGHTKKEKYLQRRRSGSYSPDTYLEEVQKLYGKAPSRMPWSSLTGRALSPAGGHAWHFPTIVFLHAQPKAYETTSNVDQDTLKQSHVSRAIPHPLPHNTTHGYQMQLEIWIARHIRNRWKHGVSYRLAVPSMASEIIDGLKRRI